MKFINTKNYPFIWCIIAGLISFFAIINGPSIPTGDSLSYFNCAKSIEVNNSHSFPYSQLNESGKLEYYYFEANTVWPPATSFILFLLKKMHFSYYHAIQILIVLFAAITVGLTWKVSRIITESDFASNIISMQLSTMWAFRYWVETSFMAEGIFMVFSLIPPLFLYSIFEGGKLKSYNIILAGFLFSLTYYIKSAAPAYIISGMISFVLFSNQNKIKRFLLFSIGVAAGVLPWLIRNLSFGTIGSSGSGPLPNTLILSISEFFRLFIPRHGNYFESRLIVVFLGLVLLSIVFFAFLIILKKGEFLRVIYFFKNYAQKQFLLMFTWIYLIVFIVVLMLSIYVLKKTSFIEMRYWMELTPFVLPAIWVVIRNFYQNYTPRLRKVIYYVSMVILVLIISINIFEDFRNNSRTWNKLPENQEANADEIFKKIGLNKSMRFFSNNQVKFETLTGLTDWKNTDDSLDFNGLYCFVSFLPEPKNTMFLEVQPELPPIGWEKVANLNDMEFYLNPILATK